MSKLARLSNSAWISVLDPTSGAARVGLALSIAVLLAALAGPAAAKAEGLKAVCSRATEETFECMSFEISGVEGFDGAGEKGGLSPENLRSAYKLPSSGGSGRTIAIVDAFNDPNAESDLKAYRAHYGLSECTTANGCFKKVNQKGEVGSYPPNSAQWSVEISLDLEMVSAVCRECHILLVEATSNVRANLEAAENEAATLKATVISNSWGGPEREGETSEDGTYFNHPGIPIVFSAGDHCYIDECEEGKPERPDWPATSPDVIAVGGTKLVTASNSRGWSESVWYEPETEYGPIGTDSGCSLYEPKPVWETDSHCSKRTDNDVAAVAACGTPLSIYDSYEREGWIVECGTSASAPIVAGVEGLSSASALKDGPEAFGKLRSKGDLFDVTEGFNYYSLFYGNCGSYLCEAKTGFDGPTGDGAPDGIFSPASPPITATGSATHVAETEATLHGSVNPNGLESEYYFEYGPTTSYGSKTSRGKIGALETSVEESNTITGLGAHTTYHYRLVATNSEGTTDGADEVMLKPTITEYSLPSGSHPRGIAAGPSSTLWVVDESSGKIDKVTTAGAITEYATGSEDWLNSITEGSDGNLWFTERGTNEVGKITPSGTIKQYSLLARSEPTGIASGSDGNLWFTERGTGKIAKISTAGKVTEYELPEESYLQRIAAGSDGNLWFTAEDTNRIGKITTAGKVTEYELPESSRPYSIAAGPEKEAALWFTDSGTAKIGRITTAGAITEYPAFATAPYGIAAGSDGDLWFTAGTATIGEITPAGVLTSYPLPSESNPTAITAGPEGDVWFVDTTTNKVSKLAP
jgi:streptogramin lyase